MKKELLLLTFFLASFANAQSNYTKYCPDIEQIRIIRLQKPWTHLYAAYNNDRHYFVSQEYVEDEHNGPALPLHLIKELSQYDHATKKLSCVYYAYTRAENSHPTLVNSGDY
jgi:hypothetical protein